MDQLISECERSQVWYLSKQGNFTGSEDLGLQIRNRTLNEWILIGGNKEEGLQDLQAEKKLPPPILFIYLNQIAGCCLIVSSKSRWFKFTVSIN